MNNIQDFNLNTLFLFYVSQKKNLNITNTYVSRFHASKLQCLLVLTQKNSVVSRLLFEIILRI
jgi:hypothetical protein